jgi:ABC-2 type transport system permease protein
MYWSIRRELWESRSIYIAPSAAAVVFLLGFLISIVRLPQKMRGLSALDPAHQREAIAMPYDMVAGLLMLTAMIVGMFYCLARFRESDAIAASCFGSRCRYLISPQCSRRRVSRS